MSPVVTSALVSSATNLFSARALPSYDFLCFGIRADKRYIDAAPSRPGQSFYSRLNDIEWSSEARFLLQRVAHLARNQQDGVRWIATLQTEDTNGAFELPHIHALFAFQRSGGHLPPLVTEVLRPSAPNDDETRRTKFASNLTNMPDHLKRRIESDSHGVKWAYPFNPGSAYCQFLTPDDNNSAFKYLDYCFRQLTNRDSIHGCVSPAAGQAGFLADAATRAHLNITTNPTTRPNAQIQAA